MQNSCFIWLFVQNLSKNGSFSTYIVIKYHTGSEKLGIFSFTCLLIPLYGLLRLNYQMNEGSADENG